MHGLYLKQIAISNRIRDYAQLTRLLALCAYTRVGRLGAGLDCRSGNATCACLSRLAPIPPRANHLAELHSAALRVHGYDRDLTGDVTAAGARGGICAEICFICHGIPCR